jgi:hypothetical protein
MVPSRRARSMVELGRIRREHRIPRYVVQLPLRQQSRSVPGCGLRRVVGVPADARRVAGRYPRAGRDIRFQDPGHRDLGRLRGPPGSHRRSTGRATQGSRRPRRPSRAFQARRREVAVRTAHRSDAELLPDRGARDATRPSRLIGRLPTRGDRGPTRDRTPRVMRLPGTTRAGSPSLWSSARLTSPPPQRCIRHPVESDL